MRPLPTGLKARLLAPVTAWGVETGLPLFFRFLRALRWNLRLGVIFATRYDEVREVFLNDQAFRVPYAAKLDVIMGGHPFFLSMDDTKAYRNDTEAMRKVIRIADIPARLIPEGERLGEEFVIVPNGRLEVLDSLVRRITFELYQGYFGIPNPPGEDLRVWATRLFKFPFVDRGDDPALRTEVDAIAPALRKHIQNLMDTRRTSGMVQDDVLGR